MEIIKTVKEARTETEERKIDNKKRMRYGEMRVGLKGKPEQSRDLEKKGTDRRMAEKKRSGETGRRIKKN
jgi:hypothetical protein